MKSYSAILAAAALILSGCCSKSAKISGVIAGAPEGERIVVGADTLSLGKDGSFSVCLKDVEKGQPQFLYVTKGQQRVASLVVFAGDRIKISADSLAKDVHLEGSLESEILMQADAQSDEFIRDFRSCTSTVEASGKYVAYYRSRIRFVLENPGRLAVVPVLTQKINESLPVFAQSTDAILFRQALDSLKAVYPSSRYVKALETETLRRENELKMTQALSEAGVLGFPNLILPGIDGQKISLAGVQSKAVLVYFWDVSDPQQKMLNLDVLLPLYKKHHADGLEIYSVCISADKPLWASVVKAQGLPWINVCDGLGYSSRALASYNVQSLPLSVLIGNGEIKASLATNDASSITREVESNLLLLN